VSESGKVLPIFLIGAVAVCIGGLVSHALYDLGEVEPKITAAYTAAWIGGVVNMVALSEMTRMTTEEFSIALGASAPVSIIALAILVVLPSIPFVRRHIPSRIIDEQGGAAGRLAEPADVPPLNLSHVAGALALSAAICAISTWTIDSGVFPGSWEMDRYRLFIVTVIAIVLANVAPRTLGAIRGDFDLGMFLMYLFFAAIGATTDAVTFLTQAPVFFAFGLTIILVHVALMLVCGRIFKFDLAELIIGSGANIVGAAPAAGIASSKGWKHLVTPGIATGMLGYAIANFIGMALYRMLG
jgi:uncharacterized membrane protein